MKTIINLLLCITFSLQIIGQIPDLQLEDPAGNFINLPDYLEDTKNYGLIFWSAQSPPSTSALEDYHNYYEDWVDLYNMEFLIVSIDEENLHDGVIDYVDQQGWQYSLFFSPWVEVEEAFGINSIPYLYLINMNGEIVFEVAGYLSGNLLDQEISELFTVGLNEQVALPLFQVYVIDNNIVLDAKTVQPFFKISIFTLDGKMILQNSYLNQNSIRLDMGKYNLLKGTMVIVKIENSQREIITNKIILK